MNYIRHACTTQHPSSKSIAYRFARAREKKEFVERTCVRKKSAAQTLEQQAHYFLLARKQIACIKRI